MRRRDFVRGVSVTAAASALVARSSAAAEGTLETTRLTIARDPSICPAPMYVAEELLKTEGFVERHDYAVQAMKEIVYGKWREFDPEDAVRFYALRLYEAGMIKSNPQKILAQGTDWRFLNELKKELKA